MVYGTLPYIKYGSVFICPVDIIGINPEKIHQYRNFLKI